MMRVMLMEILIMDMRRRRRRRILVETFDFFPWRRIEMQLVRLQSLLKRQRAEESYEERRRCLKGRATCIRYGAITMEWMMSVCFVRDDVEMYDCRDVCCQCCESLCTHRQVVAVMMIMMGLLLVVETMMMMMRRRGRG
eukprot:88221-Hanusia_phi.AAC.1